eukprot:g1722.t1
MDSKPRDTKAVAAIDLCQKWLVAKALGVSLEDASRVMKTSRKDKETGNSERSLALRGGRTVTLIERAGSSIGSVLWESAFALSDLIIESDIFQGKRVLELGSGVGLCGIVAASYASCDVVLSDRTENLTILKLNVDANRERIEKAGAKCTIHALDWCDASSASTLARAREGGGGSTISI